MWITMVASVAAAAAAGRPQHVLMVVVDDLGYADVGYHGTAHGSALETPTVDALSGAGVRLENYYVTQLCSPTRTSLLSGRYPYTIGMQDGVITNGHPYHMPVSVATMADRLQTDGWRTAAYGKWDAGMTSWGCTPTCRGFDHFFGFYNAFNDYFDHHVGKGLDLRNDTAPVFSLNGTYMTEAVTAEHIRWLRAEVAAGTKKTFAYLAHESNHGPLQVPIKYIRGGCLKVPLAHPSRRILCGMMNAVDESLKNVTDAYRALGLWNETVVLFTTDNGGQPTEGGNNYPLRGQKATVYEGGVRGVGWVGGGWVEAHLAAAGRAANAPIVSTAMMHVSDWYPTIVAGIAGLAVGVAADGTPALDGVSAWEAIVDGAASRRTEMLLNLITSRGGGHAGEYALRVGKWKLIHGVPCTYPAGTQYYGSATCALRDQQAKKADGKTPYDITPATSAPMCPVGWTPPPEAGAAPYAPAAWGCPALTEGSPTCHRPDAAEPNGGTWLFDIEADPLEQHDQAAVQPAVLTRLMKRLQEINSTHVAQAQAPLDPRADPSHFGGVWTPWEGAADPALCAAPPAVNPVDSAAPKLAVNGTAPHGAGCSVTGWCSLAHFAGPPLDVRVSHAGAVVATGVANVPRPIAGLHGYAIPLPCALFPAKERTCLAVEARYQGTWWPLRGSPVCTP